MNSHKFDYDLIVLGGGSGGVRAARWSAQLGAKVALCDGSQLGGTCVVRGCIPKKLMSYSAHFSHEIHVQKSYGHQITNHQHNWEILKIHRDKEIQRLVEIYGNILKKNNVDIYSSFGTFTDEHTIHVGGKKITAQYIIIATGSKPFMPNIPGIKFAMSSNDVFTLEKRPDEIYVVGGGYIGVEMAGIFEGHGSKVKVITRGKNILSTHDEDCTTFLKKEMVKKGIHFLPETQITKIIKDKDCLQLYLKSTDGSEKVAKSDHVLFAIGRAPNIENLNLNQVNIKTHSNGAICVNDYFQTNHEHIYAIGDVIDKVNLTPVAIRQGMICSENLFKRDLKEKRCMDYSNIPTAIFSNPTMASCGFTEHQLKNNKTEYEVYTSEFRPLKYTLSDYSERCFFKLLIEKESQKILGTHMVGLDAPEMMQGLGVAMKSGATYKNFTDTIGIHPTGAEEWVNGLSKK